MLFRSGNVIRKFCVKSIFQSRSAILIFRTKADAFALVKAFETDSTSALKDAFYAKFPNYVSMYRAFERLTAQDSSTILSSSIVPVKYANFVRIERREGANYIEMMVKSSLATHLLNQDGLLGCDDVIIKNTYDKLFEVKKAVFDKSKNKDLSRYNASDLRIENFEHKQIYPTEKGGLMQRYNADYEQQDFPIGGVGRRFACVVSFDPTFFGWSVGVTTKYMQSRWWGYGDDQAEQIGHFGSVSFSFSERDIQTFSFWNNNVRDKGRILSEGVFRYGAATSADGCAGTFCEPTLRSCSIQNRMRVYYERSDRTILMLR